MSAKGNRFQIVRGKSATRRSMLIICGAACNAALLSCMAPSAQAQASYTWTSPSSGNWSTGTNWQGGSAPVTTATGDESLEFNAAGTYTSNNDLGAFGVYNTTFDAGNGPTTLTGGDIDLYWPSAENNNPTFTDNSTNPVTINNNVSFEPNTIGPNVGGTKEYFVLAPGATTTFNGTMNLSGGSDLKMTNGEAQGPVGGTLGGPGGTMIWTQPVTFANTGTYGNYFAFRIYEGTFEMGGYTIDDGSSNAPILNAAGVNLFQYNGTPNNGIQTDVYIGPEDYEHGDTNDVASFYLIAGGESMNARVQIGDAKTMTIGGLNTSGTVYFNSYFNTLPTDGDGTVAGKSQTYYYSAAAGGTVVQNFQLISGLATEACTAGVEKVGPGTWVVAAGGTSPMGEQAYHGNTSVRDGTLELAYDDTGTNYVTLPPAALANSTQTDYASGTDGGSLGFNAPTNAVQLGDSGTLPTDNIALLTLINSGAPTAPRAVLHNIQVNAFNSSGTTSIGVADNGVGNFSGNILLNKNAVLTGGTGGTANFSGIISGAGGVIASGAGTVTLSGVNTYGGGTKVTSGLLEILPTSPTTSALPRGTVTITGGTLQLATNVTLGSQASPIPASNVNITSLAVSGNGTLDINNNHIIINYGAGADPIASIGTLIKSGFNGGAWTGSGITSTAAQANSGSYGIGYADASDPGNPAGLASGQIEIMYTLLGDANLDGAVNGTDFAILASNFNKADAAGHSGWDEGDFNYDGSVNGSDFADLASNFNKGASQAADLTALDSFAASNGLSADVPEPATLGLLSLGAIGLLRRRRRV